MGATPGDGYFYDPTRSEVEGAFFYHFAETGDYVWFPSVRNFLLGTIKCYETKAVKASSDGKDIEEDYDRTQKIWEQLATFSDSES